MRSAKKIISLLPVTFLAACGGGSSRDSGVVNVFPVESAVTSYLTSPRSFTTSYTDPANGDVYTLGYAHTPGLDSAFEGNPAKTVKLTIELKKNGVQSPPTSQDDYFQTSPFKYLGTVADTGEYTVASNQAALPANATVGDGGNFYTSTSYTDISKSNVTETQTADWNLQRDTATTAYFCANSTVKSAGSPDVSGSECYKINASGAVIGNRITISVSGQTFTFLN